MQRPGCYARELRKLSGLVKAAGPPGHHLHRHSSCKTIVRSDVTSGARGFLKQFDEGPSRLCAKSAVDSQGGVSRKDAKVRKDAKLGPPGAAFESPIPGQARRVKKLMT